MSSEMDRARSSTRRGSRRRRAARDAFRRAVPRLPSRTRPRACLRAPASCGPHLLQSRWTRQDLQVVLTESRRAASDTWPLAVEQSEAARERQRRSINGRVLPELAYAKLLVGVDVRRVGDGVAEHVALDDAGEEFALRDGAKERCDLALQRIDLLLRQRAVVELIPVDGGEDRRRETAFVHPRREHATGVTTDRTALY